MASEVRVPGVSITDLGGGRWKLRWRDRTPPGPRATRFEGTTAQLAAYAGHIAETLKATGTFDVEVAAAQDRIAANLAEGMSAFIAARVAAGKFSSKTAATYGSYRLRLVENIAAVTGTPSNKTLPVTVLGRELFEKLMERDRKRMAHAVMAYAPLRLLLDVWRWMADDLAHWPHTPEPPRSPRDYLPKTPKYSRTVAPSLEHVDACLRRLPPKTSEVTRQLGIWLRYTGLRSDTVLAIQREDIDLPGKTLHVRKDKNEYERPVPLSDALLVEARDWLDTIATGPIFPKRNHARRKAESPKKAASETFKQAWKDATAAGEVPIGVWAPPNRKNTRPEHALRAAFDAFLIGQGFSTAIVDYLVGRSESDVRATHYGGEIMDEARRAVNLLKPIAWRPTRPTKAALIALDGGR